MCRSLSPSRALPNSINDNNNNDNNYNNNNNNNNRNPVSHILLLLWPKHKNGFLDFVMIYSCAEKCANDTRLWQHWLTGGHTLSGRIGKVVASHAEVARSIPG